MRTSHKRFAATVALSAASAAVAAAFVGVGAAQAATAEGSIRSANVSGAIKGRYIVTFKADSADSRHVDSSARALAGEYGASVRQSFNAALHGFSADLTEAAAKRLAANSAVDYVEQDRKVSLTGAQSNPASWGLDRLDQAALPLDRTYSYPNTAANVHAYDIDTGLRVTNTDFGGRATNGYDFVDNDAVANDCNGHGTHTAGTIGGTKYGVAKGIQVVGVRVLDCDGNGSYSQIVAGVDWVTAHAIKPAVANMSLGGAAGSALDNAVKASIASGVTYAVAAGNEHADACTTSPARLAEAITVGATDSSDRQASFSNYGRCLDIYAPGVNITSDYNSSDTGTTVMDGTSMATPHVAGAAALILSANPTATPAQVRDALVSNAVSGKITGISAGSPNKLLNTTSTSLIPGTPVTTPTNPVSTPTTPAPTNPTACGPFASAGSIKLPDLSTVTNALSVTNCTGTASATTKVEVHIKHSYRGDLSIALVAPDGTRYKLKSANGNDGAANVNAIYTVNASAQSRNGTWKLQVTDSISGLSGTLTGWSLAL